MPDPRITETTDEARQGETSNRMRWVLLGSVAGSIVAVAAIWFWLV